MKSEHEREMELEEERERQFAAEKREAASAAAARRDVKRGFWKVWLAWVVTSAMLGAVLFWVESSQGSEAVTGWSDLLFGVAPMLLALLIAWPILRYPLLPTFGKETDWLVVTYLLVVFSVILGLLALGAVLLLILLGLAGRIRHRWRWAIACYLAAGAVIALRTFFPETATLGQLDALLMGAGAMGFMAAVTGVALRSML